MNRELTESNLIMNANQIPSASAVELVAAYNAAAAKLGEKPVTRFADRKAAERRTAAMLARLPVAITRAAPSAQRAASIAASWADPAVAAKRAERTCVCAGGKEFGSVRKAFVALGLPLGNHIKFRMALKAAGKAVFGSGPERITFSVVQ